jgi:hypothetical protein
MAKSKKLERKLYLSPELFELADSEAAALGLRFNQWVLYLIIEQLDHSRKHRVLTAVEEKNIAAAMRDDDRPQPFFD